MRKIKVLLAAVCFSVFFSIQSFAGWVQVENGHWKYDQNGILVTSQWIEDQGNWYYFDKSGIMLSNITTNIDGIVYTFDASGKWINQNPSTKITYKTYTNTEIGYSLQIPSNVATTAFEGNSESFDIFSQNIQIGFYNQLISTDLDPATCVAVFESSFIRGTEDSAGRRMNFIDKTTTQLGEFSVLKSRYHYNDNINLDLYTWTQDYKMFVVYTYYTPDTQTKVQEILSTLKRL